MARPETVLITGITGFIGAALARRLTGEGVQVFGFVRPESRRERLADLRAARLMELPDYQCDRLVSVLSQVKPQVVFNLAAEGVAYGEFDANSMFQCNVKMVLDLVNAIAATGPATLIHAGSCFEIGTANAEEPIVETNALQPFSFYGATKGAAMLLSQALAKQLGIDLITLRLFGAYGPGESPRRLVPHLIARLHRNEPVNLTEGTQVRDLLYINDVVEAFWTAAICRELLRGQKLFNVCSGQAVDVRKIGHEVAHLLGRPTTLLRWGALPARADEPHRIVGSPEQFRHATGWSPHTSLRTGLQQTINHYLAREAASTEPTACGCAAPTCNDASTRTTYSWN